MKTSCLLLFCFLFFTASSQNLAAHFTGFSQYYRCGNITVTGTHLTVEALVKVDGTGPFVTGQSANDIVSKHNGAGDANYILRPDHCEISTTTGHYISSLAGFSTFIKDSFYHVALTYDGSFLRFYVNGCLYSETAATGNLITNSYTTTIGQLASNPTALTIEQLYGYADEVRIWSVTRTQGEIMSNMKDLPNPTTQTGLLAYYKFEGNSNNIQGNTAFNAIPFGSPSIQVQDGFDRIKIFGADYTIQNPTCGSSNGSITVLPGGGKSPYRYSINGGPYQPSNTFSGLTGGSYTISVKSDGVGCSKDTTIILTSFAGLPLDFGFQPNLCTPSTIRFTSFLNSPPSFQWEFGDGQINSTSLNPQHTYGSYGNYTVKLKVQYANGCQDIISKSIAINNVFDNSVIFNNDTTICLGDSVLLQTISPYGARCWQTSTGTYIEPVNGYIKPSTTTTYVFNAEILGSNLVNNSDFSAGNTGFTSSYNFVNPNSAEGQYWIGTNASVWNAGYSNCGDHSSGSGTMMIVRSAPSSSTKVWSQTVAVTPNTNYQFAIWLATLSSQTNVANLRFMINGADLGNDISPLNGLCNWSRSAITWNSGNATTADISIIYVNAQTPGAGYALDDIYFGPVSVKTDSVKVNVTGLCDSVKIIGPDKICSQTDTLTYSIYKSAACTQQYSLQVDNAFATIISQTPTSIKLVFKQNGATSIKVAYANSCKTVIDSMAVTIKFSPPSINFGPDLTTCKDTSFILNAGNGFVSYLWQNGTTDSTLLVNSPGTYNVKAQNLCGASFVDTFVYIKTTPAPFSAQPLTATVCKGDSVVFTATGGTNYLWSPAVNFKNPVSASSKAMIDVTQDFTVAITDAVCARDTVITIPVTALQNAIISVSKSNDVSCGNDSAVLAASGGVSYVWTPNLYIYRNGSDHITVKPTQDVTYYVRGKDASGCTGQDSITVKFLKEGTQKLFTPTAFTPNGDGLNDLFRPTFIGPAAKYDFKVFNRWGQLVFHSKNPGEGWDGTFKGAKAKADVYVFYITAEGICNGKFEQKGTVALIR